MSGPVGLHGGGEYVAGDEPFLDALLRAAEGAARRRATDRGAASLRSEDPDLDVHGHAMGVPAALVRVVVLPTAAGRGSPDRAAATGVRAFERRASTAGMAIRVEVARVIDHQSAGDDEAVRRLADADLIHLPGGDPDLIPSTLDGTPALDAIRAAWERGAVLAGASAGAMALAEWTWTPRGGMRGLGFVTGLAVVPHYDDVRRTTWQETIDRLAPGGIGYLGLDERTGAIGAPNGASGRDWLVAGRGAAYWFARGAREPIVARSGGTLHLPG